MTSKKTRNAGARLHHLRRLGRGRSSRPARPYEQDVCILLASFLPLCSAAAARRRDSRCPGDRSNTERICRFQSPVLEHGLALSTVNGTAFHLFLFLFPSQCIYQGTGGYCDVGEDTSSLLMETLRTGPAPSVVLSYGAFGHGETDIRLLRLEDSTVNVPDLEDSPSCDVPASLRPPSTR